MSIFEMVLQRQLVAWWCLAIFPCSTSVEEPKYIFYLGFQTSGIVFKLLADASESTFSVVRIKTPVRWASKNLYFTNDVLEARISNLRPFAVNTPDRRK